MDVKDAITVVGSPHADKKLSNLLMRCCTVAEGALRPGTTARGALVPRAAAGGAHGPRVPHPPCCHRRGCNPPAPKGPLKCVGPLLFPLTLRTFVGPTRAYIFSCLVVSSLRDCFFRLSVPSPGSHLHADPQWPEPRHLRAALPCGPFSDAPLLGAAPHPRAWSLGWLPSPALTITGASSLAPMTFINVSSSPMCGPRRLPFSGTDHHRRELVTHVRPSRWLPFLETEFIHGDEKRITCGPHVSFSSKMDLRGGLGSAK
jgi:hypothetical protein